MNTKKVLLWIVLIGGMFGPNILSAQTVSVSSPVPMTREWSWPAYFSENDELMVVKKVEKGACIQKFEKSTLKELNMANLTEEQARDYDFSIGFANKYYAAFSNWNKETRTGLYYLREIDFKSGQLAEQDITLSIGSNINFYKNAGRIVVSYLLEKKENKPPIYIYRIYNTDFKLLSEHTVQMPYVGSERELGMNDQGEFTAFIKVTDSKSNDNCRYEVLKINQKTSEVEITPLQLPEMYKRGQAKVHYKKDELIVGGYYNTSSIKEQKPCNPRNSATGVFLAKFDLYGNLISEVNHEIPMEIYTQYTLLDEKDKQKKLKDKNEGNLEYTNIVLRDIKVEDDGSVLIIGEGYFRFETFQSNGTSISEAYYSILVAKLDASGKMLWMRKLPKAQVADGGHIGGYEYMRNGKTHYFVFEDSKENKDITIEKAPFSPNRDDSWLAVIELDHETGAMNRKHILNLHDVKGQKIRKFKSNRVQDIGDAQFIFDASVKSKQDIFIKVDLLK